MLGMEGQLAANPMSTAYVNCIPTTCQLPVFYLQYLPMACQRYVNCMSTVCPHSYVLRWPLRRPSYSNDSIHGVLVGPRADHHIGVCSKRVICMFV